MLFAHCGTNSVNQFDSFIESTISRK